MPDNIFLKCSSKGSNKAPGKGDDQPFDFAPTSGEGKMRSLRSLHERWSCFTLKRPRTSWGRPHSKLAKRLKGGPNVHQGVGYGGAKGRGIGHGGRGHLQHELRNQGKETLMESGLIQKFPLYCESYESSSLSLSSNSQEKAVIRADSSSSSVTNMGFSVESSASLDNGSSCGGDGFSSDEVMSLVDCSEMEGVLDFMASTMYDHCTAGGPDTCEKEGVVCGTTSSMESKEDEDEDEDGEPYRIDLCDFEPDLNAPGTCTDEEPPHHGSQSGVLCLRLDYEEVLRAWKDGGGCLWACGTPPYHPIPLDGFHTFALALPPHPSYC